MPHTVSKRSTIGLPSKLAGLTLLLVTAGALASSAFQREDASPADFICEDGFRFMVEAYDDHLRLRTGSGVFALVQEAAQSGEQNFAAMRRYSDGNNVLWTDGQQARLQTHAADDYHACEISSPIKG